MKKMALLTLLCASSLFAWSSPTTAKISYITVSVDGGVFFALEGGKVGTAGCNSAYATEYTVNTATDGGKSIYALLVTAKSTGVKVTVQALSGIGCWYEREVAYLVTQQ